jgi:hypothetical protein
MRTGLAGDGGSGERLMIARVTATPHLPRSLSLRPAPKADRDTSPAYLREPFEEPVRVANGGASPPAEKVARPAKVKRKPWPRKVRALKTDPANVRRRELRNGATRRSRARPMQDVGPRPLSPCCGVTGRIRDLPLGRWKCSCGKVWTSKKKVDISADPR